MLPVSGEVASRLAAQLAGRRSADDDRTAFGRRWMAASSAGAMLCAMLRGRPGESRRRRSGPSPKPARHAAAQAVAPPVPEIGGLPRAPTPLRSRGVRRRRLRRRLTTTGRALSAAPATSFSAASTAKNLGGNRQLLGHVAVGEVDHRASPVGWLAGRWGQPNSAKELRLRAGGRSDPRLHAIRADPARTQQRWRCRVRHRDRRAPASCSGNCREPGRARNCGGTHTNQPSSGGRIRRP